VFHPGTEPILLTAGSYSKGKLLRPPWRCWSQVQFSAARTGLAGAVWEGRAFIKHVGSHRNYYKFRVSSLKWERLPLTSTGSSTGDLHP
jgi:hypothetical protein